MPRPDLSRVPAYARHYINQAKGDNLAEILKMQSIAFSEFLRRLPAEKRDFKYGPDKWTIREMVQHILDTERVFAYRALCIARGEQQQLPGFDENSYAANSGGSTRSWDELTEEFHVIRRSTELLFGALSPEQLEAAGITNKEPNYVLGIGFTIAGHVEHHLAIIKERYL